MSEVVADDGGDWGRMVAGLGGGGGVFIADRCGENDLSTCCT